MRNFNQIALFLLILLLAVPASAFSIEEASKRLPNTLASSKRARRPNAFEPDAPEKFEVFGVVSAATRKYQLKNGEPLSVSLIVTRSESSAYALLTNRGCAVTLKANSSTLAELGPRQCVSRTKILFARGVVLVELEGASKLETLQSFARAFAPTLDNGEGDIPVLVKHLPGWPNIQDQVFYAVSQSTLKDIVVNQPVLDEINFTGGAEAVVANYGTQSLMLVEFNTASLATDNDQRIRAKLVELYAQGQAVPSAYRRVGNYAVFVFGAPDEQTANQLIDQVKYQQVVQWLGENPFSYEQATREFTETTLGVFVSVVKASGLALLATLAVGGFFGTMLFRMRRSQQRAREAYADSDAMLRLNLDDLTPESDPARLLGRGN